MDPHIFIHFDQMQSKSIFVSWGDAWINTHNFIYYRLRKQIFYGEMNVIKLSEMVVRLVVNLNETSSFQDCANLDLKVFTQTVCS